MRIMTLNGLIETLQYIATLVGDEEEFPILFSSKDAKLKPIMDASIITISHPINGDQKAIMLSDFRMTDNLF